MRVKNGSRHRGHGHRATPKTKLASPATATSMNGANGQRGVRPPETRYNKKRRRNTPTLAGMLTTRLLHR